MPDPIIEPQDEISAEVRRWVDQEVIPVVDELEHNNIFPDKLVEGMKNLGLFLLMLFTVSAFAQKHRLTEYVNPFIGTGGHGHTYPGATTPFGMIQLSPDTRLEGWDGCGGYHYSDNKIS